MLDARSYQRILITGVTGSGGSYVAEHVARENPAALLAGFSRWHSTTNARNLEAVAGRLRLYEVDLMDLSSVIMALRDHRPDAIIHLASHANVRASFCTPLAVLQNNIMGTANLLEGIRLAEVDPWVLLCSTSEVYGQVDPKHVPITEECPICPSSPYAVSKVAQDLLGFTYWRSYGMKVVRTRMFAYLNPRRADLFATAFALQVARIECGLQTELVHGNLDSVRTLIDVRDAAAAYWAALQRGRPGEVYNIGGETTMTVGQFLDLLKTQANCPIPTRVDPALLRPADVTLQIPDTTRFRNATGWHPEVPFAESVRHLLDHCRAVVRREARPLA
jgi:GDPmannose 4,6-dehydratase/GDP-4-dehydro-6-deoxy-D-mannose reductase